MSEPSMPATASSTEPDPPMRGNRTTLRETLAPLKGRRVADIGCGDGAWTRFLTGEGAHVVGLDPNPVQMNIARAAERAGDETYMVAGAEALPLADGSQDIALFFNSLHHVPSDLMAAAVTEAARIVRPGGLVAVFEPVARGANYALNRPVDDEAEVRALAHQCLHAAAVGDARLALDREFDYGTIVRKTDSFDDWRAWLMAIDPSRASRFRAGEGALRTHFARVMAERPRDAEGLALLDQPMRVTVLRRLAA